MTCCTFFVVSHQSYASRPISFRVSVRTPNRDAQRVSSICERRTLACCTYSAPWVLLEASVTSAEAARGRAFIDPNMAGRSHGLRSCFSVRPSFESRTMIVPHQSPSACQAELTVHHRALRSRVISETCWCLWRFVRHALYISRLAWFFG